MPAIGIGRVGRMIKPPGFYAGTKIHYVNRFKLICISLALFVADAGNAIGCPQSRFHQSLDVRVYISDRERFAKQIQTTIGRVIRIKKHFAR